MARKGVLLRMEQGQAEAVAEAAAKAGLSVNSWLCQAVQEALDGGRNPSSGDYAEALRVLEDTAAKLRRGFILVPEGESLGASWDQMMGPGTEKRELGVLKTCLSEG